MPTAFAMALDLDAAEFMLLVGHDGGQIAFPGLPEPMCRRGFHVQECIAVALNLGISVTPIELFPVIQSTSAPSSSLRVLFGPSEATNWSRFTHLVHETKGVLDGLGRRCGHAVAYERGCIFDPDGQQYPYSREECERRGFYTRCLWRVDRILRSQQ